MTQLSLYVEIGLAALFVVLGAKSGLRILTAIGLLCFIAALATLSIVSFRSQEYLVALSWGIAAVSPIIPALKSWLVRKKK